MGIITTIIGILVGGWQLDNIQKKVNKLDTNPYNDIKSDKWRKAHPEYDK